MTARTKTIIICVAVILVLIGWDTYLLFNAEQDDLISNVAYDASRYTGALPFFFGMLGTHFFWPTRRVIISIPTLIVISLSAGIMCTLGGYLLGHPELWGMGCLVLGLAAGKLWPNKIIPEDADDGDNPRAEAASNSSSSV